MANNQVTTRLLLSLALALIISAFVPYFIVSTKAAELRANPAIIERVVRPGEQTSVTITVENTNDQPLPMQIEFLNPTDRFGAIVNDDYLAAGWLSSNVDSLIIPENDSTQIAFTINTPQDAVSGGKYANIVLKTLRLDGDKNVNSSIVIPEIQIPVLLTVPGEIYEDANINLAKNSPLTVSPNSEVTSVVEVENTGNIHNLIQPKIVIRQNDEIVAEYKSNASIVIPGTSEKFEITWTAPNQNGLYSESAELLFGSPTTELKTAAKTFVVGPSLKNIFIVGLLSWTILYIFPRRKNIAQSIKVLLRG